MILLMVLAGAGRDACIGVAGGGRRNGVEVVVGVG